MGRFFSAGQWGLLIVAAVASVLLVGSAYYNSAAVDKMIWTATRGQAVMFDQILRQRMQSDPADTATLESVLAENEQCGLRYVELSEPALVVGAARGGPADAAEEHFAFVQDRVRVRLPARGETAAVGDITVEFEPVYWQALRDRADMQLVWSGLASIALFVMALVIRTRTRRAEEALAEAQRSKHLASLGEMTAVLAHEIRNPLTALRGHAQLLLEETEDAATLGRAERVVNEATRLEVLTRNLLGFVRSGRIERTAEDPASITKAAVAAAGDVTVVTDDSPALWSLDPLKFQQAIANLVSNAVEANEETGADEAVVVDVAERENQLQVRVSDRGPGLTEEAKRRAFEPFFTSKTNGTGLGLAVAKRVVTLHGGRIGVSERPGGGSIFEISIPPEPSGA